VAVFADTAQRRARPGPDDDHRSLLTRKVAAIRSLTLLLPLIAYLSVAAGGQGREDPALKTAVERFFAMQEAEDVEGYLALWSKTGTRPTETQLRVVFESGDDKYSEVAILSVSPSSAGVRVRVNATRERTMPRPTPAAPPRVIRSTSAWVLVYVRENGEWKVVREGSAVDGLADALLEARTAEERETLLAAEPTLVNELLVAAVARRAGQSVQKHAYAVAQREYELMRDLARRVGSARMEGEALQNLANAMYFQRNLPGALTAYEERLAIERTRENTEGIAAALLGIATVRYSFAEYGLALIAYREALAIQEKVGEETAIATTLVSTGNVLYLQGDYPAAIADYRRSRDLYKAIANTIGEADALEGMGRVYLAQGDYAAALDAFTGVLAEAKARDHRSDQGSTLLSIGDVHFRLGNLQHARQAFEEARGHFVATKSAAAEGRAYQGLAVTDLVNGHAPFAEDEYRKGAAACERAADRECVAAMIVGLAFAQTAQDKYAEGIASYRKGIDAFTALGRREASARAGIGLAQALLGSDDFKTALTAATRARTEGEGLRNDDVLWRALVEEARALRRLRERPRAIAAAMDAVAAVERLVEVAKVRPSSPVPRDSSAALATLALLQAEAGEAAAAFESVERMRTHELRVLLAPGEREIVRGMTEAEREEERALAVELVALHAQRTRERGLPKPDAARIGKLEARIEEAAQRRAAQQQRLFERLPSLRVWRGQVAPATRAETEALLPDRGTVLLQLVVGEDVLVVLIARRGDEGVTFSSMFEAVSRKAIAGRVAALLDPATLKDPAAWRTAALALIPGLTATIGAASRVIVMPHDVLWRVPFEALPTENGVIADAASVVYSASITALVRSRSLPPESGDQAAVAAVRPALVIAAPELAASAVDGLARTAPGWAIRAATGADQEIAAVSTGAEAEKLVVLRGAAATEAAVRERLPQAAMVHLAAPFRVNGASPLFSAVLLGADDAQDGTLEAREIMNLTLAAQLTVVTDGHALSMRESADEAPVVAWAWRAAGVPALVIPRWASDDAAANALLTAFHARLRAGDAPEVALQAARTKIRAGSIGVAPLQWASWMLIAH
jgi:tetratricopeptide (TPR) repeat protein/CHAT domain-containing protein